MVKILAILFTGKYSELQLPFSCYRNAVLERKEGKGLSVRSAFVFSWGIASLWLFLCMWVGENLDFVVWLHCGLYGYSLKTKWVDNQVPFIWGYEAALLWRGGPGSGTRGFAKAQHCSGAPAPVPGCSLCSPGHRQQGAWSPAGAGGSLRGAVGAARSSPALRGNHWAHRLQAPEPDVRQARFLHFTSGEARLFKKKKKKALSHGGSAGPAAGPFCAGGWGAPAGPGRARSRYGPAQRPAPAHGPRPAAAAGAQPGEAGREGGRQRLCPGPPWLCSAPRKRGPRREPAGSGSGVLDGFSAGEGLGAGAAMPGAAAESRCCPHLQRNAPCESLCAARRRLVCFARFPPLMNTK